MIFKIQLFSYEINVSRSMFGTAIKYYFGGLALDTKINVFSHIIDFRRPHLSILKLSRLQPG